MRQQYCSGKQKRKLLQFQMKPGLIMLIIFANYSKSTIILHRLNIEKNKDYIANAIHHFGISYIPYTIGLTGMTHADGLALGRPSGFVADFLLGKEY